MTDTELRVAHAACVDRMRKGESYAKPVPSVIDLHIEVSRRAAVVIDRRDLVARALYLGLALADAP